jgi:hypothetical protein
MTTRLYYILLIGFASLALAGCGSDESGEPAAETEKTIALDKDAVDIKINGNGAAQILEGNGDYSAFSLNDSLITVTVSGNALQIQAYGKVGSTGIIVSDKNTQLKLLPVTVYRYDKISLEKSTVDAECKLGNKKEIRIKLLESNGECTALSGDETIATAQSADSVIVITAQGKAGSTDIVLTDESKRRTVVRVNATTTVIPYDDTELVAVKNRTTVPYFMHNGQTSSTYYTYLNTVENGMNVSGYDYYNYYILKIYYPGNKSVGEKQGCKISYTNIPYGQSSDGIIDMAYFNIVKNDGTKIWAVYSFVDKGVLKWGNFIQNINP